MLTTRNFQGFIYITTLKTAKSRIFFRWVIYARKMVMPAWKSWLEKLCKMCVSIKTCVHNIVCHHHNVNVCKQYEIWNTVRYSAHDYTSDLVKEFSGITNIRKKSFAKGTHIWFWSHVWDHSLWQICKFTNWQSPIRHVRNVR